jgi:hypothetical protein
LSDEKKASTNAKTRDNNRTIFAEEGTKVRNILRLQRAIFLATVHCTQAK